MTKEQRIREDYFDYLCRIAGSETHWGAQSWKRLLRHLNRVEFEVEMPADQHRVDDAHELRWRWAEYIHNDPDLREYLPRETSVLEVMLRLAVVIEERYMTDDDYGDRTAQWFFYMISSMGLNGQTDEYYSRREVDAALKRMMHHEYDEFGNGGLFYLPNAKRKMNEIELWDQAMHFIVVTFL